MPLKKATLDGLLIRKLRFERVNRRHPIYELPKALGIVIPGVFHLSLQHGRDDVSDHIVKQISNFLGLDQRKFAAAHACDYSARAIFYSMLVHHMERLMMQAQGEPVVFARNLPVYTRCIPAVVRNLETVFDPTPHRRDRELLTNLQDRLDILKQARLLEKHSERNSILAGIDALKGKVDSFFR